MGEIIFILCHLSILGVLKGSFVTLLKKTRFAASCSSGLEELLSKEIGSFGGEEITRKKGIVFWVGELSTGYRACLWSRIASRIFLHIAEVEVQDEAMLYEKCGEICWQEHFDTQSTFSVSCTLGEKAILSHSHFVSLRVKDAIVDQFRNTTGDRPSVKVTRPRVKVHVHLEGDVAHLSIDLSGESLHKRGYRTSSVTAPLKETLASAIVALAGWPENEEFMLLDPMCGSGTLLIEAALLYGDSAPGLSRPYYGFLGWKQHNSKLWRELVDEAIEREERGLDRKWPRIIGYDADKEAVAAAKKNIKNAGLAEKIEIQRKEVGCLQRPGERGLLLANLPFGERLLEMEEVSYLYRALGRIIRERFVGWSVTLFLSKPELVDRFGVKWEQSHRLFNGPISCRLLLGLIEEERRSPFSWHLPTTQTVGEGVEFANRFRKNVKERLKWAKRENISCFRVYDRDIPEFNITVDLYDKWVHVQEYAPPKSVETEIASKRFHQALSEIRDSLGVRRDRVFIKTRSRQKGKKQYEKKSGRKKFHEVREGNCYFLVNFTDYLDTGLFLDHRPTRSRIAREAKGKRFLNLFGYTGTATVHAAQAGAVLTTTVDLSATYLHWARMNLSLNGFGEEKHEMVRADTLQWLKESNNKYDLIFMDPPTFSNTKKKRRVFDIQRDHAPSIGLAMRLLDEGGMMIFSSNFKRFNLDKSIEESFDVRNISKATIPHDFKRNSRVHQCWDIRKRK
ncbi:MAG: bifunctional 23S rRNA (guanine(2069)-N(7))-methyltransferase RlmK/23S rRNA (guanine(2445)-N(2))-methyltransferase RlmL [Bacteroidetes bacterium]|nr:bifunctional 23S rRNA (guanine(2069)-N(7))-methyltransferase RlmK/23S rRNA (guanine(2445)-N(2))-methyltransferase RlmL [Bacteroidota bacterium]